MGKFQIIILILIVFVLVAFIATYARKPTNIRDWEVGMGKFPEIQISGDGKNITIKNLRNYNYSKEGIISQDYLEKTYNLDNLEKVWFLIEPFSFWDGIAHTYFIFDFTDQEPIAFSVEARRVKGSKYNAFAGIFNQYELIYTWGTEHDFTGRRIYKDNGNVYMYPLKVNKDFAQKLFLESAKSTEELRNNPRFYNTITSNCTNNLAKIANEVKPGSIPFHYALYFPGYSPKLLYNLGYFDSNLSFDELKEKSYISNIVNKIYNDPNFTQELRENLN